MNRRDVLRQLAALQLGAAWPAFAQSPAPFRVAWVSTDRKDVPSANLEAFRAGMRDAGYVEGRNLVLDVWLGDGSGERVIAMVPDIVRAQPDIIVAAGGLALFPLVRAGVKTPIVFSISADPVEARIVDSFARPGGNLTGISLFTLALVGKRMEIMKEMLPGLKRIAVTGNTQHPGETKEGMPRRRRRARSGSRCATTLPRVARSSRLRSRTSRESATTRSWRSPTASRSDLPDASPSSASSTGSPWSTAGRSSRSGAT